MSMMKIIRSYSELITIPKFLDRYEYLRIGGEVGAATFGYDRYLNQILYTSDKWRRFRRDIIIRDEGRDLACEGFEIGGYYDRASDKHKPGFVIVHHINPITVQDVLDHNPMVFDPDNVVCTSRNTHNAIHYGDASLLVTAPVERSQNDMCPWRT